MIFTEESLLHSSLKCVMSTFVGKSLLYWDSLKLLKSLMKMVLNETDHLENALFRESIKYGNI